MNPIKKKLNMYGLPSKVIYCEKCNISNQQPTTTNEYFHNSNTIQKPIEFDDKNICAACNFNKLKWDGTINWHEREEELLELLDKHRKNDGTYDCIVGGSGGKDSAFQSHVLKYKYNMHPLTVTWAPHLYTDIGWQNHQSWVHQGGFDNFLYTPNGKIHQLLTRESTINLMHPFQPFILGQKSFVVKMAARFNIPLIFYGEMPGEYGRKVSHKTKKFFSGNEKTNQEGYSLNSVVGNDVRDLFLGGKKLGEYLEDGIPLVELKSYLPLDSEIINRKKIEFYFLGYFLRWVPQEMFYYASKNTGFKVNPVRTEGTYSKYNSIDDKIDGFFYYSRFIKFGIGRAMMDSAQEIRNGHVTKEEGLQLIKKFDGEYPIRFEKEFLNYIDMEKDEFVEVLNKFRPPHIWKQQSNGKWELKLPAWEYFKRNDT